MFNKKILFLITLIFMLSFSAVAAAETNSSDDMVISDVEDEPPSGSVEPIQNDEDALSSANVTSSEEVLSVNNGNSTEDTLATTSNGYSLSGNDVKMYYKDGSSYKVTLLKDSKPLSGKTVAIKINGATYKRVTDANGKASIALNINSGFYIISAYCCGITTTNKVNILPVVKASDVNAHYKSTAVFSAKFFEKNGIALKNTVVRFILDGKTHSAKTGKSGIASLSLANLKIGSHSVYSIHPNGYKILNKIVIKSSITTASPFSKHYKSTKKLSAKFFGKNNQVLAGYNVKFIINGKTYVKKTNSEGIAYLGIGLNPGTYKVEIINPSTGEKVADTVKVFRTIYFNKKVFSDIGKTSTFKVTLYKNEELVKDQNVYIYIKGTKFTAKTDSKGVASLKYKLAKGSHSLKIVDQYTGCSGAATIYVCSPTIQASDMYTRAGTSSKYYVTLYDVNGNPAKYTKMEIKIDDKVYTVKTNVYGKASVGVNLKYGDHTVVSKDLATGYTKTTKIHALKDSKGMRYDKYGVSSDGNTILAIGRPSAIGEESQYGYSFYQVEFLRTCPYCGGHHLYWSIFWAGNEYTDVGVFPATGHKEGSSAEGGIFCADCDCDWSIFGKNRGDSGGDLTPVSGVTQSSKADAYELKSGSYVHP